MTAREGHRLGAMDVVVTVHRHRGPGARGRGVAITARLLGAVSAALNRSRQREARAQAEGPTRNGAPRARRQEPTNPTDHRASSAHREGVTEHRARRLEVAAHRRTRRGTDARADDRARRPAGEAAHDAADHATGDGGHRRIPEYRAGRLVDALQRLTRAFDNAFEGLADLIHHATAEAHNTVQDVHLSTLSLSDCCLTFSLTSVCAIARAENVIRHTVWRRREINPHRA